MRFQNIPYDFNERSIPSNLKTLEYQLREESIDGLVSKKYGSWKISTFFYELSESIEKNLKLLIQMSGHDYDFQVKERESILLETKQIEQEIMDFSKEERIEFESIFNIAKNYADAYLDELAELNKAIKENEFMECEECSSLMQYLEFHQGYCCSNEDCNHQMEL